VISPADIFCLAIIAGLMLLEAHRGIIPALIDFLGVLLGLVLTRWFYVSLSDQMRPSGSYMLLLGAAILITAIISIMVSRRLRINVTEVEAAIAAGLGLCTAILISYAFFEWVTIRYGAGDLMVKNSVLHWAISEASGLREIADFFRSLTGK
jgi:hypothetical protein